ncbi:type I-E CRISPR-associated protein Cse2/CasB [Streptomyces sp. SID1034]|uniref:type I-E CRISPR-associated protein Cse2/CasB n=1 Tax=Streptomyces sp. SID1034 TaxID=2690248 RepID=UPI00137115CF|nr:type I-E CRISPR-associated protein Cse2/CasB [Streptomyces sp. SID1034]MYV90342.1 type I-E CRISPR-associated protein Cse2/CasB [Streptomyces sp. SID1034]
MTRTASPAPKRPYLNLGAAGTVAGREITRLQGGYLRDESAAVAALARLRRGVGKGAGTVPDLWGVVDTADLYAPGGRDEADTVRAEEAVHTALTLWATHQQSRPLPMHRAGGHELGSAVRELMAHGSSEEALRKRFVRAGTAGGMSVLATRLREIVLLLRQEDIALDYALLAHQLHAWPRPGGADAVRSAWGRSFHAYRPLPGQTSAGDSSETIDTGADAGVPDLKDVL